jgi:hypothetical protein
MNPMLLEVVLGTTSGDVWFALFLLLAVLTYSWSKNKLGDAKIAVIFVLILAVIVLNHTEFVWVIIGAYLFITYGKQIFKV